MRNFRSWALSIERHVAMSPERSNTLAVEMVDDLVVVGDQSRQRVDVTSRHRGIEAAHVLGGCVRAHAAPRWGGDSRRGWLGDDLVEAGERLVLATGVELFPPFEKTVRSKRPERESMPLVGAAGAIGAEVHPMHEQSVFSQAEDVVDTHDEVCPATSIQARSARRMRVRVRSKTQTEVRVVHTLDVGCEHRRHAIDVVDGSCQSSDARPIPAARSCAGPSVRSSA